MIVRIAILVWTLLTATSASATVVYNYSGANYNQFLSGGYTTSMSLSGSLTLETALPANLAFQDITSLVIDYSFSTGLETLSRSDPGHLFYAAISTDSSGNILNWGVQGVSPSIQGKSSFSTIHALWGGTFLSYDLAQDAYGNGTLPHGEAAGPVGSWTISAIPESSTWTMMVLGFCGVGVLLCRRTSIPRPPAIRTTDVSVI